MKTQNEWKFYSKTTEIYSKWYKDTQYKDARYTDDKYKDTQCKDAHYKDNLKFFDNKKFISVIWTNFSLNQLTIISLKILN